MTKAYENTKRWRLNHPDINAYRAEEGKKWRAAHPEIAKSIKMRSRAKTAAERLPREAAQARKRRAADPTLTKRVYERVKARRIARQESIAGRKRPIACELCLELCVPRFDHCHAKGHFRGWLCDRCNRVLGSVKDSTDLLAKMINYLKRPVIASILALILLSGTLDASPVYNATAAPILQSGQYYTVWSAETPTPGNGTTAASQQVALQVQPGKNGTPFSVDGKFSGAPGSFEVDVQVAASDSDTNYQTCSGCNITTVDSTNNTFHLDGWGVTARFVRLLMRSRGNSVSITATVTGG